MYSKPFDDSGFGKTIADCVSEGVYIVDSNRNIVYWNQGAQKITGFNPRDVIGRPCFDDLLCHTDDTGARLCHGHCPLAQTLQDGEIRKVKIFLQHKQGHRVGVKVNIRPLKDENGKIIGAVEAFSELPDKEQLYEEIERLKLEAYRDHLTGLFNRSFIERAIKGRLSELRRYGWPFGLFMIDIDFFKKFNDIHGHLTGDAVLKMVGRTLSNNMRSFDQVARWGGEEFLALATNVTPAQLKQLAERARLLVKSSSLRKELPNLSVTISIGATLARPEDDINSLITRADAMLYASKDAGRNCVTIDVVDVEE